jgi:hypothetical protein
MFISIELHKNGDFAASAFAFSTYILYFISMADVCKNAWVSCTTRPLSMSLERQAEEKKSNDAYIPYVSH